VQPRKRNVVYNDVRGDNVKKIRIVVGLVLLLAWVIAADMNAHATSAQTSRPEDFLVRTYNIHVTVDCLEYALTQLMVMPGIDLYSTINVQTGWGRMERLVDSRFTGLALDFLRNLGTISRTESQSRNEFAAFAQLQSEFRVRNVEYERLMEMLYESVTLADFRIIEARLREVIAEMERIRGGINHLNADLGTTTIHITLTTTPPEPEPVVDPEPIPVPEIEKAVIGSLERIRWTFADSAEASLGAVQNILVFLSYVSIPLTAFLVVGGAVLLKLSRRKGGGANGKNDENDSGTHGEHSTILAQTVELPDEGVKVSSDEGVPNEKIPGEGAEATSGNEVDDDQAGS